MTSRAGAGVAVGEEGSRVVREAARRSMESMGGSRADWALVFAAPEMLREDVSAVVKETTGARTVVGCSARGVIGQQEEHENTPGTAILTVRSNDLSLRTLLEENLQVRNHEIGREIGKMVRSSSEPPGVTCLFPDAFSFRSHALYRGLQSMVSFHPVLGGTASGHGDRNQTYQLLNERVAFNAISGFTLEGDYESVHGVAPAHHPVGPSFFITRGEGNMIAELDGEPALQVLFDIVKSHTDQFEGLSPRSIFVALSIDPEREYIPQNGYVIREVAGVDRTSDVIALKETIQEGQRISFAVTHPYAARENLRTMLEDLDRQRSGQPPLFGIYVNCCGRGTGLYGDQNVDVKMIRQTLGDFPLIGFQSNGELAPLDHRNYEHRYTGVLLLIDGLT